MSNDDVILRRLAAQRKRIDQIAAADHAGVRLPYAPRVLNPFPLASSGAAAGEFPQSRALVLLAFAVSVFVATTNNGTNYWTIVLADASGATLASVTTSALAANTWTRLDAGTPTQPGASNVVLSVRPTATLSPGAIYIVPELVVV